MKATREQVLALAREAANAAKIYIHEEGDAEFLERLVHLAQRFERDRLRAIGGIEIRWRDGASESLYRIPETLE